MEDKLKYPDDTSISTDFHFTEKNKQHVLNALKGISSDDEKQKARRKNIRKIAYSGIAAVILFTMFIASARFSPVMAKVVAQIPYFSQFVKQQEYKYSIYDVISDVANKKGYKLGNFDVVISEKKITLTLLGQKEEITSLKNSVVKNINKELEARNFGKFKIAIKSGKEKTVVQEDSPEVKQFMKDSEELQNKIVTMLNENHYIMAFPPQVRINKIEKFIYVAVPKTESKQRMKALKSMLLSTSKEYGEFKFRISRIDMKAREQEKRWDKNQIISILAGGLMENKDFKVTGFSYSFHPLPLQIIIKTSVKASDPVAKGLANKIENEIKTFIKTDEITKDVRNDPYEITIYSKDKKKIN